MTTRSADKARRAEEAARRAEDLAEQARKAAEEARAALREAVTDTGEAETETLAEDLPADDPAPAGNDARPSADEDDPSAGAPAGTGDETVGLGKADEAVEAEEADEADDVVEADESGEDSAASRSGEAEEAEEPEDAEDAEAEPVAKRRRVVVRAGLGASGAVLLLLAVALGGAAGWLWFKGGQLDDAEEARKQVAFAAAQAAQDLSSYDYRTVDSDLRRAAEHTTGKFHDDFVKESERVKATARKEQTVTEGVALKTGIEQVTGSTAVALVFLNQETAKTATVERLPSQYTLRLTMRKVDGRWRVEKLQLL